jgi:hypothetical protein
MLAVVINAVLPTLQSEVVSAVKHPGIAVGKVQPYPVPLAEQIAGGHDLDFMG